MAKETTIIFLYDTKLVKSEEDDPNSAILYFYPTWVSDHQKTALCGQLIGTVICLRDIVAMPELVHLQSGKFALIENGQYILVVGSDRNIPDWTLKRRITLIYSLIKFYHHDFVTLGQQYQNDNLNAKLYHIFDTCLKLLYLGGNIFTPTLSMDLTKTVAGTIAIAQQFLSSCQTIPNVLGGILLFHNKVIHTQLSTETSKQIAFSDPYRIYNPAELHEENLPQSVKLFHIYISRDEYQDLLTNCSKVEPSKTNSIQRDTSLLFTSVPEDSTYSPPKTKPLNKSRPNSLILKNCNVSKKSTPTSAVSTPLSETKSFVDPIGDVWQMNFPCSVSRDDFLAICFDRSKKLSLLMRNFLSNKTATLRKVKSCSSITNEYSKELRRSASVDDPLYPWFKKDKVASQCYVQQTLNVTWRNHRKKSLILPLKPPNASEPLRIDPKSPGGGYSTPLMNKLSAPNVSEKAKVPSFSSKVSNKIEHDQVRKCLLFMYGERDLVVGIVLQEGNISCPQMLADLHSICTTYIPKLEQHLKSSPKIVDSFFTLHGQCRALRLDNTWDTVQQHGLWDAVGLSDLSRFHEDFQDTTKELYLRRPDSVLYGYRDEDCEVFFQESAPVCKGLLHADDCLGRICANAKKALEKDN